MLQFDNKNHTVSHLGKSVTLPPLSFRLLEVLATKPEHIFSVAELTEKVWTTSQVSAETLKQRVFVLRKAIDESAIEGISIQAIRGEGYRLLIAVEPKETLLTESITQELPIINKRNFLLVITTSFLLLVITVYWFFIRDTNLTPNNRVLLWTNIPIEEMSVEGNSAYQEWRTMLANENKLGNIQLILSDRVKSMLVPIQARKDRAGLISHFELVSTNNTQSIRLSIVEPTTATILRSDIVELANSSELNEVMLAQFSAIKSLIVSNQLCLLNNQRDNSQDPIWQELREIANKS